MDFKHISLILVVAIGCAVAKTSQGDGCIFKSSGEYGVCTYFGNCSSAIGEACRGSQPQPCASYDADSAVCCKASVCPPLPPGVVSVPVTGYKAWDHCTQLAAQAYPCRFMGDSWSRADACPALPDPDKTEGVVLQGEYPHLALLSNIANSSIIDWKNSYVGALISDKWVLTSALILPGMTYVKLGGLTDGDNVYKVAKQIRHPDYVSPIVYNDIGLVELEERVTFSKFVLPACIHTGSVLPEEKLKYIKGPSPDYYSTTVAMIPHSECAALYDSYTTYLPEGTKEATHFCVQQTDSNSMIGKYGAPLQVYNGGSVACTQTVIGVFAFAGFQPHLMIRVAPFIPWIESVVWP